MAQAEVAEATRDRAPSFGDWVAVGPVHRAEDRDCDVFFEGLLDNAAELRRELALADPASAADIVLSGYRRFGADVLPRMRGSFALMVRDHRRQSVLCARDALGTHPLFYARVSGQLIASSSTQALADDPRVPSSVNRTVLASHLCHRWPDPEQTYFEAVRRVLPGHALQATPGGAGRLYRHWDPVWSGEEVEWVTESELERFDFLFDQAVDRCVNGGHPGIYLSGGLDSVAVAAVAADRSRTLGSPNPSALSLIFPPPVNEEPIQRGVAEQLRLPHAALGFSEAVGDQGLLPAAVDMSRTADAPIVSFWLPAYRALGREGRRRGCTTILTGGGGDEWLTVTPVYAADLLLARDLGGLYSLCKSLHRSFRVSWPKVLRNALWRFGAREVLAGAVGETLDRAAPWALRAVARHRIAQRTPAWVAPDPALRRSIKEQGVRAWPKPRLGDHYMREGLLGRDHPFVGMELEQIFENSRRVGVPVRSPFLDADLVDFLYRVPPELLNRGGRAKGVVRETLAKRFPELGFERQKKVAATGFSRPLLTKEGGEVWRAMGGAPALVEAGIVDRDGVEEAFRDALAHGAKSRHGFTIWYTLSLEAWLRPRL